MRLFVCFFFVFSVLSSPTPAFSEDCGCSGQAPELDDNLLEALETWKAQQVWERPSKVASNVSAIIEKHFWRSSQPGVGFDPLNEGNTMGATLFEEITRNSISTASAIDSVEIARMASRVVASGPRDDSRGELYVANLEKIERLCTPFTTFTPTKPRNFIRNLKRYQISLEQLFFHLRCPTKSNDYKFCTKANSEKLSGLGHPLCGDLFYMGTVYPIAASTLSVLMDSLIEMDMTIDGKRFLPQIVQCKRLTKRFYNEEKDRFEKRCLSLVELLKNKMRYNEIAIPHDITTKESYHHFLNTLQRDYFNLLPDESPPTIEFCKQYTNSACQADLPDSNAW